MKLEIGDHGDWAFDGVIDDSYGWAKSFGDMGGFLHEVFFPRCAFGPHYLKPSKSPFFPNLEFVGLTAPPCYSLSNCPRTALKRRLIRRGAQ